MEWAGSPFAFRSSLTLSTQSGHIGSFSPVLGERNDGTCAGLDPKIRLQLKQLANSSMYPISYHPFDSA
jgi:hypothetical protein